VEPVRTVLLAMADMEPPSVVVYKTI
jgi:hypothetical protein